ncbi:hypothetical protein FV219_13040 [Methylobacterium sp. WL122]|nr:hypothetical protein FV219_13040 [Methylobacterium sp. WL122]
MIGQKMDKYDTMSAQKKKYGIVACARWESSHICEWIDYHRSIGFERFYIYCNDDDPQELYRTLLPYVIGSDPIVVFYHNPFQGNQAQSIKHFYRNHADHIEWIAALDIDEFLNLKKWSNISDLISEFDSQSDAIYFNWLQFGPGDHQERPSTDVLSTYINCESDIHVLTKHITRTSAVDFEILRYVSDNMNHYWFPPFSIRGVNVIGDNIDTYWENYPLKTRENYLALPGKREAIIETAVLNHYVFKSRADFSRRIARGLRGGMDDQASWLEMLQEGRAEAFLESLNAKVDRRLAEYWVALTSPNDLNRMIPLASGRNLAFQKLCNQSSASDEWRRQDLSADAGGAVNGSHTGAFGFHTGFEEQPWWQVDLGEISRIAEVRIFNRLGTAEIEGRLNNFDVCISNDGDAWETLYRHEGAGVGGIDGRPLIIRPGGTVFGRHLRIQLHDANYLHLDQVEIWGD